MSLSLYPVRNRDGQYGYMTDTGEVRIPFRFEYASASEFSENLAHVMLREKWFLLDVSGQLLSIREPVEPIGMYSEGFAVAATQDGQFVFLDRFGKIAFDRRFEAVSEFGSNVAAVKVEGRWGLLDTRGHFRCEPSHQRIRPLQPSEGFTAVKSFGRWGLISISGRVIVEPTWDDARDLRHGLIPVKVGDRWGLARTDGDFAITPTFSDCNYFPSEQRWGVKVSTGWAFLDLEKQEILEPLLTYVLPYSDGMARVYVDGTITEGPPYRLEGGGWGFLDASGHLVISAKYDAAGDFVGRLARVEIGDTENVEIVFRYVDREGRIIWAKEGDK